MYYFAAKDVTERHEAELLSHHSEALLQTLTANLPDTSVFLIDHDLRILIADGAMMRQLTWLDESMFRGRKVTELYAEVPDEVLALSLEHYQAALDGKPGAFEFVSEGLTFAIQALPVRADDDTVESALVIVRDVTERTRAEQQIARSARQQTAVAELGRFALESHDLSELMARAVTTVTATLGVDVGGVLEFDEAEHASPWWRPSGCPAARSARIASPWATARTPGSPCVPGSRRSSRTWRPSRASRPIRRCSGSASSAVSACPSEAATSRSVSSTSMRARLACSSTTRSASSPPSRRSSSSRWSAIARSS